MFWMTNPTSPCHDRFRDIGRFPTPGRTNFRWGGGGTFNRSENPVSSPSPQTGMGGKRESSEARLPGVSSTLLVFSLPETTSEKAGKKGPGWRASLQKPERCEFCRTAAFRVSFWEVRIRIGRGNPRTEVGPSSGGQSFPWQESILNMPESLSHKRTCQDSAQHIILQRKRSCPIEVMLHTTLFVL
ncbi:uncharacterized protein LOC133374420 isoform X2 [Rhineura floridana]|uniref:uncharacterized protein LOC133374420 isoform X2 n=1 Tax=Rhineura floridana TaxID=261503 RepID=UPI002AC8116E|nr:uncharacterized protein LOC133374420 isoform X2 [Rhineura floridana]